MDTPDKYLFMDGGYGELRYDEPRWIEDDFVSLVESNILRREFTPKGAHKFLITRAADTFINQINGA